MALQGDLMSFALPDVLRLLAGTGKSGCLEITGPTRSGEIWLGDGAIVAGVVSDAPHATTPAGVIFELLRLESGSFVFDDGAELGDEHQGDPVGVDDAIAEAEALAGRWAEVETVVPSMDAWLTLLPELEGDEAVLSATDWRGVAAIGSGGSVRDLGDALGLTDLDASMLAKGLIEGGLIELRASHTYAGPTVELDSFDEFETPELADLDEDLDDDFDGGFDEAFDGGFDDEDRPVVMEDRDDALLPEPLPGEGVSYEGDEVEVGSVDGRTIAAPAEAAPADVDPFEAISAAAVAAADPATTIDTSELIPPAEPVDEHPEVVADHADHPDQVEPAPVAAPAAGPGMDEERGSLLKFLSSVKH